MKSLPECIIYQRPKIKFPVSVRHSSPLNMFIPMNDEHAPLHFDSWIVASSKIPFPIYVGSVPVQYKRENERENATGVTVFELQKIELIVYYLHCVLLSNLIL